MSLTENDLKFFAIPSVRSVIGLKIRAYYSTNKKRSKPYAIESVFSRAWDWSRDTRQVPIVILGSL